MRGFAARSGLIGPIDIVVGVGLSVAVFVIVHVDLDASDPHGDVLAGLVATATTLPVIWARRWPVPAAAVAALGVAVNWAFIGHFIRCGAALPAVFWIACVLGLRTRGRATVVGLTFVAADVVMQSLSDPQLDPPTIVGMVPVALGFWFAGRVIRSRTEAVRSVAERNEQIAATRQRTTELAVASDRERIAAGLDGRLQQRVRGMAAATDAARAHLNDADAPDRLAAIAADGRETLTELREVVGSLRGEPLLEPQPDLDRLSALVQGAGGRLHLSGTRRQLPTGVEVSAYRIVEQLLRPLSAGGNEPVDVEVRFAPDALELRLTGNPAQRVESGPEFTVVRQRVLVHGGSVRTVSMTDRLQWVVQLPLSADHV